MSLPRSPTIEPTNQDRRDPVRGSTKRDTVKPAKKIDVLALSAAGQTLAVELRFVVEVFVTGYITPAPRAPRCLVGNTNLRGAVVPLVDTGVLIDESRCCRPLPGDNALLVEYSDLRAGLLIERIIDVYSFPLSGYRENPSSNPLLPGSFQSPAGQMALLDVGAALHEVRSKSHAAARRILDQEG